MFNWLVEGRFEVYALLLLIGVVCAVVWWYYRGRRAVYGIGICVGLALALALLDFLIETEREQVVRKMHAIARAINEKDFAAAAAHVADDFNFSTFNKSNFQEKLATNVDAFAIRNVRFNNLSVKEFDPEKGTATLHFDALADHNRPVNFHLIPMEADWVREGDGQWRMRTVRFFKPFVDSQQPLDVPLR